jgi:hypothetical protein
VQDKLCSKQTQLLLQTDLPSACSYIFIPNKIWLIAHIPKPAFGSPLEHGCKDGKFGLESILFEGHIEFFSIPKNEEVVSHPVRA